MNEQHIRIVADDGDGGEGEQREPFQLQSLPMLPSNRFPGRRLLNFEVETTESLSPVAGHVCVEYRGCLLCWGGYCYDERDIHYRDCDWLYILPYMLLGARSNIWLKVQCETDLQLRPNSGATAGIYHNQLFIFGGCIFDEHHRRMVNTSMLLAIDLCTGRLTRKRYPVGSKIPTPRDKTTSWIANDKFFIFGGYGMSWHRLDHGQHQYFFHPHHFLDDDMGSCWNNQLLYYDLKEECWVELEQSGSRPSARAASASVYVSELNKVFLFGGRHDQTRLNDLYVLDLGSSVWTQIDAPSASMDPLLSPGIPPSHPEGRSWCSFTLLNKRKKILMFGGLCPRGQPLSDLWELDIAEYFAVATSGNNAVQRMARHRWRLIPPLEHQFPTRLWHCAVQMANEAVLFYGGMNEAPSRDSPFVRTLIIRQYSPPTLRQLALNALSTRIMALWSREMSARKIAGGPDNSSILGRRMNPDSGQMDIFSFCSSNGFFANLPQSLHSQLRMLLAIRKHAKSLSRLGGTTPRSPSPAFRWQPPLYAPLHFHLLQLDGWTVNNNNEDDESAGNGRRRRSAPSSPKSARRALADDLLVQIGIANAGRHDMPFLQALFNSTDCL